MEKRNPNGGAATPPQDDDLEVEDEDIVPLSEDEEDADGSQVDDEDVEDEDEFDTIEDSGEEATPVKEQFTCPNAEVVEPERVALKDSFVEPILPAARALPVKKAGAGPPPKPKTPSSEPASSGE